MEPSGETLADSTLGMNRRSRNASEGSVKKPFGRRTDLPEEALLASGHFGGYPARPSRRFPGCFMQLVQPDPAFDQPGWVDFSGLMSRWTI